MLILIELLKKVKDYRRTQGQIHPLWLILLLVICGTMMQRSGYRELERFVKNEGINIIHCLKLKVKRLPSLATIRRALMGVNPDDIISVLRQWMQELETGEALLEGLAIDGKSIKSTLTNYSQNSQNFVCFVSVFSQSTGLTLDLAKFENKHSSEIVVSQALIKASPKTGQIFTLDAIHCQKITLALIVAGHNHFIITLKKNQSNLYKQVEKITANDCPIDLHQSQSKSHGRLINRRISVFAKNPQVDTSEWPHISSFIKVERWGMRGNKPYEHRAYYVSDLLESAEFMATKIQGHWSIENQNHWVKDVLFKEDKWPIRGFQAASNLSVLRTIALNLYRILGFLSVKEAQKVLGTRIETYLFVLA